MSANSTQQTVEKKEAVKDVKPMKPPIKPKPFVAPKPKQALFSTNSEVKSPVLSPNSGEPCSPTIDIPSAFKISQLTGPQPYGTRRTSLRRWSSSVGEEVPVEGKALLSPVENVVPELYSKVATQPLAAPVKSFQAGSVWKGKSPFMLTTRGWGEQKSQGKDIHESASVSQKYSLNSKDDDIKETVLDGKTVINSSSPSRSISTTDHEGVDTKVQDLKQNLTAASEEVEKTPFEFSSPGKLKQLEKLTQDNEIKKAHECSSQISASPQTDLNFGITKQSTHYEHNKQDTKAEDFSYKSGQDFSHKSGQEATGCPKDIDAAFTQVTNTSLRTNENEEPQMISLVSTAIPKANVIGTENTATKEENPLSDTSNSTAQEVYRYHENIGNNIPEHETVMREEQEADPGYLQTSQSQITNPKTEQWILEKSEHVEKLDISSEAQITDKPLTEKEMYINIPHEEKECTISMEHNLLRTDEQYDLHEGETQVASDNNNIPYQEYKNGAPPIDMQFPVCTVRSYDSHSEEQEKNNAQIHGYNTEEEQDLLKNTQREYEDPGEHVTYQASEEKQTDYPSEYRSVFEKNARHPYYSETPSAPELSELVDHETSADLYVRSQILENDNLIPVDVYSYPVDESKQPSQSIERVTQSGNAHEELSQLETYESSRPESDYNESQFIYSETSQDPAARVIQPEELSDHYRQPDRLVDFTTHSPILNKYEIRFDDIEHRDDELNRPQYDDSQSQELEYNYADNVELEDKQSDELVHIYGQSEEPDYKYQQLEKSVHTYEQSDKPNYLYGQLEEQVQRSELSEEPEYVYEQPQEPATTYHQPEGSDIKYEQTEDSSQRHQKLENSNHKYELLEEPYYQCEKSEETIHRDDQSEEPVYGYQQSEKPTGKYKQSEPLVQSYQQNPSANVHEPSEESEHRYADLEETVHTYEQLEDHKKKQLNEPTDEYEQKEQSAQKYEESILKYETLEEPINRYRQSDEVIRQSEEVIHSHDQSQEPDYRCKQEPGYIYKQHDVPANYELVNQYEPIEDPAYIQTRSDAKDSVCTQSGLIDLESFQEQNKRIQSEEMDSIPDISKSSCDTLVKYSEEEIRPGEYLEQQRHSYTEKPKSRDSSTLEMHESGKMLEEQVHKYPLPEEQELQSEHKKETQQYHAKSEEAHHADDLTEGSKQESPTITTIESDESMAEKDQEAKITYQTLNGHAEQGELHTVDYTSDAFKEIQAEEPEVTQEEPPAENFDFLDGTVVLDSSFMRGRASLGKKRGHRTPAGACAPDENDPEYWMFRDSTEPKSLPEKQSDEEEKNETSPDGTPNDSPSPVKSPNRKGIFAGIISPSLLKGRLKTRSKTTEEEVKPEAEESKSPGKEKPESSSHSLNWLQALKKKKKSTKESPKAEKKKQPK
ncbi:182 kDa tankyrase-1-binding protein [Mantella aurantiaca]